MKTFYLMTALAVIALLIPWASQAETVSRGLHETVVLSTQAQQQQGSGSYFPAGIGVWGTDNFSNTGNPGIVASYDPTVYTYPPSLLAEMGPGHAGSNSRIYLSGSVKVTGKINVPQQIVLEALAQNYAHCDAGWSCSVGSKLPVGLTGEPGDETEYAGPRNTTPLQGWKPSQWPPEGTFLGGTPCWPTDPGYVPITPFYPQWDKDGDGTTSTADYDYFAAHGGFAAEQGGAPKDDPTIMKLDKGVLVPASEGTEWYDDYYIDANHNFIGTWKTVYLTGPQYRFHSFRTGSSEPIYFNAKTDFYTDSDYVQGGGCDMIFTGEGELKMAVKGNFIITGEADLNHGPEVNTAGQSYRLDVVTTGNTLNLANSADGSAGTFYAPLANVAISGDGYIYASVIGKTVSMSGSRSVCYPITYTGPNGGLGGTIGEGPQDPANPVTRENWKEIIITGE